MPITLTKEDGAGLESANTYNTNAEFKSYADDYSIDVSGYTDPQIDAALVESGRYISARWGNKFAGSRLQSDQGLDFPRSNLKSLGGAAIEGVPTEVSDAQNKYAILHLSGGLYAPDQQPSSGSSTAKVKRTKKVVGPLQVETEFHGDSITSSTSAGQWLSFPSVDSLLTLFTKSYLSGGGSAKAVR